MTKSQWFWVLVLFCFHLLWIFNLDRHAKRAVDLVDKLVDVKSEITLKHEKLQWTIERHEERIDRMLTQIYELKNPEELPSPAEDLTLMMHHRMPLVPYETYLSHPNGQWIMKRRILK